MSPGNVFEVVVFGNEHEYFHQRLSAHFIPNCLKYSVAKKHDGPKIDNQSKKESCVFFSLHILHTGVREESLVSPLTEHIQSRFHFLPLDRFWCDGNLS